MINGGKSTRKYEVVQECSVLLFPNIGKKKFFTSKIIEISINIISICTKLLI